MEHTELNRPDTLHLLGHDVITTLLFAEKLFGYVQFFVHQFGLVVFRRY